MRVSSSSAFILVPLLAGCADQSSPTRPSAVPASSVPVVYLEGEAGTGDGQVRDRSRASGEQTVHLGPDDHRDSGDSVYGWNLFVTDSAGTSTVAAGRHTLTLEVTGGDGCVEIDVVTLTSFAADRSE